MADKPGDVCLRKFLLTSASDRPFSIRAVRCTNYRFTATLETTGEQSTHIVGVAFTAVAPGDVESSVIVETSLADQPPLMLPVTGVCP